MWCCLFCLDIWCLWLGLLFLGFCRESFLLIGEYPVVGFWFLVIVLGLLCVSIMDWLFKLFVKEVGVILLI